MEWCGGHRHDDTVVLDMVIGGCLVSAVSTRTQLHDGGGLDVREIRCRCRQYGGLQILGRTGVRLVGYGDCSVGNRPWWWPLLRCGH
ncbi:hypothetical protein M6B38_285795 [Iris pallida]|uniref:Uncharacterized protein n=1 Tax=Iris pallida TaxID=29817 RepID=A0AAX6HZ92_IRIPA|nr:hypothetical protein M6B38_285795 [Iris pallida]